MIETIPTSNIPAEQRDALKKFAEGDIGPELHDLLLAISRCIDAGADLAVFDDASTLTPTDAAKRLGMSRTHLYKLLDRGEIVSHRVGRDRRIRIVDLAHFEQQRQRDRRELAERFAKQQQTRAGAVDEVAELPE